MGENSTIQWTDHTFNIVHGCMKVSEACDHCYAEKSYAVSMYQAQKGVRLWGPESMSTRRILSDGYWLQPAKWNRAAAASGVRARVFCSSLADVFEDNAIVETQRQRLWPIIEATPWLDWQLLTKRPQNIMAMIPERWRNDPQKNVWFGCTVENMKRANERIEHLLRVSAAVRFLSCEPMTEELPLDLVGPFADGDYLGSALTWYGGWNNCASIDWIICGGESGPKARPFDVAWAKQTIALCEFANVPVFVKQLGALPVVNGKRIQLVDSHGGDMAEWATDERISDLCVREFPKVVT